MIESDRTAFQPPQPGGKARSLALALFAHLMLLLALTWGIRWNQQANTVSVSAELWSALPQEAAPALQESEPNSPPLLPPVQEPEAEPIKSPPQPTPPPVPSAAQAEREQADIALQKEKELKKQRDEKLKEEKALKDKERKEKAEKIKLQQERENKEREEKEREKKKLAEKIKAEEKAKQLAEEKKRAEAQAKKDAQAKAEAEKRSEAQRQENIRRMQGMAGAAGDENAKGSALKASGPSAGYPGRIRARIKPNITFNEELDGNPKAEVEVQVAPDGTILRRKLIQSSGSKAWDEAVLKAIDKTETLPRDTDGRVQPILLISFRPKD